MARQRSVFFRKVRSWLKLRALLLLLALFLSTEVLPSTWKYVAAENSVVQSQPDAQKLVQQGSTLYYEERFNQAALVFQQATAAFAAQGDELRQAMTLSNLSLTYQQLGQWPQASQAIAQSLNLLKTGRNAGTSMERSQILAQTLDIQGRLQLAQGQAYLALTTWTAAAKIYAQLGDATGATYSRINSAQALQALGLYRQAQKTLTEVNQNLQQQPDSLLKAIGLRSLGNTLRIAGDLEQSRQILQQSLAVATRSQSLQAISDTLLSLGNTARVQQHTQAAINFYQQAATAASPTTHIQAQLNQLSLLLEDKQLVAAQALWPQIPTQIAQLPPSRMTIYARINFAQSLMKLGRENRSITPSSIAQLLVTAIQQAERLKDQRATSYALGSLGELYEQTQQWSDALDLTQQALFIAQAIDAPDVSYRWQWQLGRLLKAQGDISGAIAAYTEAVNNLNSLRRDLVAMNPEAQFSFRDQVEPVYWQLVDLLLQTQGLAPSEENLAQARNTIESLQLAELENFFRSACLDFKSEQIDQIIDSEDRTAAVIYPVILSERLEVILKLPQEKLRHYVTNKSQAEVESTLEKLRQYLKEPDRINETKKLSQQVYSWLIQPLEAELGKVPVRTLVFVLNGPLRNIPMAVLYNDKQKQYLVENYALSLAPSLSLLNPKQLQQQSRVLITGLDQEREVEGREFSRLENVRLELQQIESEVPRSKELFNQEFTKTNLQKQIEAANFSVVHMATHGSFSSDPNRTFILTWNQLLKVQDLDSLLRISNGSSRSRTIELLVLSACQTAAGDKRAALGLAGVAVRAGARSTLATLWQVNDSSTAKLMIRFYHELFTNKVSKAEALRQAQIALLTNDRYENYESPYYWAPYVLLGNWF